MGCAIELLAGPSRRAKTETLLELCRERIRDGREDSFLFLVPSHERAGQVEDLLASETAHGFFRPFVGTFNRLIQSLYNMVGGRGAPISNAAKSVLIQNILLSHPDRFPYLSAGRAGEPFPGLIAQLCDSVSDFKRNLIDPDALDGRIAGLPRPQQPAAGELASIYRAYQELLRTHGLMDDEGVFWLLLEELGRDQEPPALDRFDLLLIDGIHDLTVAEERVLRGLMQVVGRTVVSIDHWPSAGPLGRASQAFRDALVDAGAKPMARRGLARVPAPAFAPAFEAHLFARPSTLTEPWPCEGAIAVLRCADRQHEVKTVAEAIRGLADDKGDGLDLSRVCVAVPRLSDYVQLVRELFPRYGIPFQVAGGLPLDQAPAAAAAVQALRVVIDGYQRRDVVNLLRSPYLRFQPTGASQALDGSRSDWLSREAGVIRGRGEWAAALERFAEELRRQIADIEAGKGDEAERGDSANRADHLRGTLERTEAILPGLLELLDVLSQLEGDHEPEAFRSRLVDVLSRLEFQQQVVAGYTLGLEPADVRRDAVALGRFWRCVDSVVFSLRFAQRPSHGIEHYHDMLASALAETLYQPERPGSGVRVAGVRDTRALDVDHLFLAGMVEQGFPRARGYDIFFSESSKRHVGLKVDPDPGDEDRYLFYQCLVRPAESVTLLWPEKVQGQDALRSPFLDELMRISDVEAEAPLASQAPFTVADFHIDLGRRLSAARPSAAGRKEALALLTGWAEEQPDQARSLVRNLAIRDERKRTDSLSRFQGWIVGDGARPRLADLWPPARPFSVSQLESYGRCPFAFFAERVLRIAQPEEPSEDLSALTRGDLVHQILRRYYVDRRGQGRTHLAEDDDLDREKRVIRELALGLMDSLGREGLWWEIDQERLVGREDGAGRPGLLPLFVETEAGDPSPCEPAFFEVPFGQVDYADALDDQLRLPELVLHRQGQPPVVLVGKIDRIDLAGARHALVMDYKTGSSIPGLQDTLEGVHLQMPVYLAAVQAGRPDWELVGAVYYKVRTVAEFGKAKPPLVPKPMWDLYHGDGPGKGGLKPEDFDFMLQVGQEWILDYAQWLRSGQFPPMCHPRNRACLSYCPYRSVCRVDPARMTPDRVWETQRRGPAE